VIQISELVYQIQPYTLAIFLILIRLIGILFLTPMLSNQQGPIQFRILLLLFISLLVFINLKYPIVPFPDSIVELAVMIVKEMLLGAFLGMLVRLIWLLGARAFLCCKELAEILLKPI